MKQSLEQIAARIEAITGFTIEDLRSKARNRAIVIARQLFCYLAHETGCSYSEIGRYVNRDHTTAMYSYSIVISMKDTDRMFKHLIEKYNMSEKIQILKLIPPQYGNDVEKTECDGFACPHCNGNGWIKDWGAKRDEPVVIDCDRCGGSGKLKAEVVVKWSAEEKEVKNGK
jgi:hypothetical protein